MLFLDFAEFTLDFAVVFRHPIEFGHRCPGFLYAAFAIGVAGRFREEEDPYAEDERPDETNAHWYAPGARVGAFFGTKVDGVGGEDACRDEKLVSTYECSTHLTRSSFARVHRYHY